MPRKPGRARAKARKPRKDPAAEERAFEVLSLVRYDKLPLTHAARLAHTTPRTARKYLGRELQKTSSGRYVATPSDRLTRRMWLLTKSGNEEVSVRGSRKRREVALHRAAVNLYLRTGGDSRLAEFQGKGIRSGKLFFPFITDTAVLDRLAHAGEISFERVYALRA